MKNFFPLMLVLLAFAFLLRVDFIFYILYLCLGLYLWSRWYTPRILRRTAVQRTFHDHAFWGETVAVELHLKNDNRLSVPWLELTESVATELRMGQTLNYAVALGARQATTLSYHVQATRRGYYRLGPLILYTGDLFGFVPEETRYLPADYLTIYPRLWPLAQLGLPSRLPFGTLASRQRLFEDPARPMGVREFRSGDALRQIDWKVSAHTRQLVVRRYQPAISLETAIALNLHGDDYDRHFRQSGIEWAVEVAASLAAHLIEQRQAVGLSSNGVDPLQGQAETPQFDETSGRLLSSTAQGDPAPPIPPRNGRPHLMKVLERLARLEPTRQTPFAPWLTRTAVSLHWGVTVLVISPQADETLCQALHRLVRAGLNPILLVVQRTAAFGEVRQRARRLGFTAYEVFAPKELQWVLSTK